MFKRVANKTKKKTFGIISDHFTNEITGIFTIGSYLTGDKLVDTHGNPIRYEKNNLRFTKVCKDCPCP